MTEKFPDISEVDETNGDDVKGIGCLFISLLHENGQILMYVTPSDRQKELIAIIELWLEMARKRVGLLGAGHRAIIMDRYDMLYRYVYRSVPDFSFINQQRYSVVESLIKDNKNIDVAETLWMITLALEQSKKFDFIDRAKDLHDTELNNWIADFTETGNFLNISQDEAVKRVLTFIREDIHPFTGSQENERWLRPAFCSFSTTSRARI